MKNKTHYLSFHSVYVDKRKSSNESIAMNCSRKNIYIKNLGKSCQGENGGEGGRE